MSIGEEQSECPLCMETLEMDDLNFFPCTCGYQICRFCWHRIRTDENGLCPACRKAYPEDPAAFRPLTDDEIQRIKKDRKMKDLQRKQKAAENRKHLANVRVVQRNLCFVVGLSQRLADPEVLKKPEYFGKFGKLAKVVINQSTSYAGSQVSELKGPSASAYLTYYRSEDALKAIHTVNNVHVDGRTLKCSLGTTKYCSHFLRGSSCTKPDCMYLHELGDEAASFTKEEMQQGKHTDYENKLCEEFTNMNRKKKTTPEEEPGQGSGQMLEPMAFKVAGADNWGATLPGSPTTRQPENFAVHSHNSMPPSLNSYQAKSMHGIASDHNRFMHGLPNGNISQLNSVPHNAQQSYGYSNMAQFERSEELPLYNANIPPPIGHGRPTPRPQVVFGDQLRISSPQQAFAQSTTHSNMMYDIALWKMFLTPSENPNIDDNTADSISSTDDDLGFDPYSESAKGLKDLIEKEKEEQRRKEAIAGIAKPAKPATPPPEVPPVTAEQAAISPNQDINDGPNNSSVFEPQLTGDQPESHQAGFMPSYGNYNINTFAQRTPNDFQGESIGNLTNMDMAGLGLSQNGMSSLNTAPNGSYLGSHLNMGQSPEAGSFGQMNNGPASLYGLGNGLEVQQQQQQNMMNPMSQMGNLSNYGTGGSIGMNGIGQGHGGAMGGMNVLGQGQGNSMGGLGQSGSLGMNAMGQGQSGAMGMNSIGPGQGGASMGMNGIGQGQATSMGMNGIGQGQSGPIGMNSAGQGQNGPMGMNGIGQGQNGPMGMSGIAQGQNGPMGMNGPGQGQNGPMGMNGPGQGQNGPIGMNGPGQGQNGPIGMNGPGQGQGMGSMGLNMFGGGVPQHMNQGGNGGQGASGMRQNKPFGVVQPQMMPNNNKPNFTAPPFGHPNFPPPQLAAQQSNGMPNIFTMPPGPMSRPNFDPYDMKDWQESLRALLPNINISFASGGAGNGYGGQGPNLALQQQQLAAQTSMQMNNWELIDPAIVHSGNVANDMPVEEPHWMASLHNLTEEPVPQGAYMPHFMPHYYAQ